MDSLSYPSGEAGEVDGGKKGCRPNQQREKKGSTGGRPDGWS